MSIHTFVYISSMRAGLADAEVDTLLASAVRNNTPRCLTGVLLQYADHFVQALEGPREALDEIVGRIVADGRHHHLTPLGAGTVDERRFGRWSMLRVAVRPGEEPGVDEFFRHLEDEPSAADVEHLMHLLDALAQRH